MNAHPSIPYVLAPDERCSSDDRPQGPDRPTYGNEQLERKLAEQAAALQRSQEWIRSLLDAAGDAIITVDRRGVITDANPACQRIFCYSECALIGRTLDLLLPQGFDADDPSSALKQLIAGAPADPVRSMQQWIGRRSSGDVFPVELRVTEIDHRQIFLVIVRDITGRKELERQVLDASSREQRRIAQDLHDELGQELTGLRYMALNLVETLSVHDGGLDEHDIAAALAQRIASGIATAQQHLRGAIRGIMPVDVDAEGLEAALRGLAERTNRYGKTICRLLCNNPVRLEDNAVATQLYRIAQEAVTNAVKHGRASQIYVRLESDAESVTLSVSDDGPGIDVASSFSGGWGLRIMQYRAGLIGAELKVQRKEPRGTVIICSLLLRR